MAADAKTFAFETFPPLLGRQVQQYENLVNDLCERVHQVCGPAEGIAFLLDRYERRPQWLKNKQNFWNLHGARLNNWRQAKRRRSIRPSPTGCSSWCSITSATNCWSAARTT